MIYICNIFTTHPHTHTRKYVHRDPSPVIVPVPVSPPHPPLSLCTVLLPHAIEYIALNTCVRARQCVCVCARARVRVCVRAYTPT